MLARLWKCRLHKGHEHLSPVSDQFSKESLSEPGKELVPKLCHCRLLGCRMPIIWEVGSCGGVLACWHCKSLRWLETARTGEIFITKFPPTVIGDKLKRVGSENGKWTASVQHKPLGDASLIVQVSCCLTNVIHLPVYAKCYLLHSYSGSW